MALTISRWCLGVALACVAVASITLPFPAVEPRRWATTTSAALADEITKLVRTTGNAYTAVRRYRSMQALERWRAASARGDTALIRVDASVPASLRASVRAAAAEQWTAVVPRASAVAAEVFVYVDSSAIPRASTVDANRRALEPRRLVDVSFAMPEAVGGSRCVTFVRLRATSPAHVAALNNQSLVGPCGFYASFGLPGKAVQRWLAITHYRFLLRSDWDVPRAPAIDQSALYALTEPASRCLTGTRSACTTALGLQPAESTRELSARDPLAGVLDGGVPATAALGPGARSLGQLEGGFLADVVRDVGPERFARFWRSESDPDGAFAAATGESLGAWTQRWLDRTYGPLPEAPAPRALGIVWLALLIAVALFAAARPRQSVLSERLRPAST